MLVNSCILGILASSGVFNENTAVFSTKSTKTRNRYSNNFVAASSKIRHGTNICARLFVEAKK